MIEEWPLGKVDTDQVLAQVQWALARVNSFVTKSSGTWGGADKDLAAKVKGRKINEILKYKTR
jgi:hypothetical protein